MTTPSPPSDIVNAHGFLNAIFSFTAPQFLSPGWISLNSKPVQPSNSVKPFLALHTCRFDISVKMSPLPQPQSTL